MIALLLACHTAEPRFSEAGALAPTIAATDADGDGALTAAEYERLSYAAVPFDQADADGDGSLEADELAALIRRQDPQTFDNGPPAPPLNREVWAGHQAPPAQLALWELLMFLRAEVEAAGGPALPSDKAIAAASQSGDVSSAAVQGLLVELAAQHEAAGLVFPEGLLSSERRAAGE